MTAATIKLIEAVERLNMTGEIGDGMVANLHELAGLARLEITPHLGFLEWADAEEKYGKPDVAKFAKDTGGRLQNDISRATVATAQNLARRMGCEFVEHEPAPGSLPMRHECNCECHRSPGILHLGPCCR